MLLAAAAVAAAYLLVSLPKETSAADPYAKASTISTLEHPREDVLQELIVPALHRAASPKIGPVLGVGLLIALSTALFLLLRCIQRLSSSQKESGGVSIRRLADKDEGTDECENLEEALVGGSDEGEGVTQGAAVGGEREGAAVGDEPEGAAVGDEPEGAAVGGELEGAAVGGDPGEPPSDGPGFGLWATEDRVTYPYFDGLDPIPPRGSPFPPADPPVTLSYGEALDRASLMNSVADWVSALEENGWTQAGGRTMPDLLRKAFDCRQRNANVTFGPDVPLQTTLNFKDLIGKMEDILVRNCGLVRWGYISRKPLLYS